MDEMTDKPVQEAPTGIVADSVAWIKGSEMDRAAAYALRGRAHFSLSDAELFERWKAAVNEMARDFVSEQNRAIENDLKAEIDLRGLVPPWTEVNDALLDAIERFAQDVNRMQREDPDLLARLEDHFVSNAAAFKAKKQAFGN